MCGTRLAENAGPKKVAKNHHLGTIVQLCRAMSSQLRHVSTIGKKFKQQCVLHMFWQYGELRPTNGWDLLASLGHPCKFQRVSRLGSVTVRHSSSGRQPNFAALNRGRHLYSAGRPSRWALAHILVQSQILLKYFSNTSDGTLVDIFSHGHHERDHSAGHCAYRHWSGSGTDTDSTYLNYIYYRHQLTLHSYPSLRPILK